MFLYQLVVLAIIQGITEFLPVSSSAHLVVTSKVLGWPDQGIAIDIAVHLGSLLAILWYLRKDVGVMVRGGWHLLCLRPSEDTRLLMNITLASVPVIIAGFIVWTWWGGPPRSIVIIILTTVVFGILLWVADRHFMTVQRYHQASIWRFLLIGMAQVLALIPGVSRSGIVITAARMGGMQRQDAARISLLLAIPALLGAAVLSLYDLRHELAVSLGEFDFWSVQYQFSQARAFMIVAGFSALFSFFAAKWMMQWLAKSTFFPFVLYRLVLAVFLAWYFKVNVEIFSLNIW